MRYPDELFARQLQRQLERHGPKSIFRTRDSLYRQIADHQSKLSQLEYRSSVQRELRTFRRQIETVEQFIIDQHLERNGGSR